MKYLYRTLYFSKKLKDFTIQLKTLAQVTHDIQILKTQ